MTHAQIRQWHPIRPDGLRIRSWDALVAVYNPLSGDTHLLDDVTGTLMRSIAEGLSGEPELEALLRSLVEFPDESSCSENLRFMLYALQDIGLIESHPAC